MIRGVALLALAVVAAARTAGAVCTANDVAACGNNCWSCVGNTCTLARTLDVTPPRRGATCTFNFGTRDVRLVSGGFDGASSTFEIRAHSLTVGSTGVLKARGGGTAPGGTIILTLGTGGLNVLSTANPIDVGGANLIDVGGPATAGAGSVIIRSDGNVNIGGTIVADGSTTHAAAGTIDITAGRLAFGYIIVASGRIVVRAPISASAKALAAGGSVTFTAIGTTGSGIVDIENPVATTGGTSGGNITVSSTGDTILGLNPNGGALFDADGNGDASDGGTIKVTASGRVLGTAGLTSPITARASSAVITTSGGGIGGEVTIEASGSLTLGGGTTGGIAVDGGQLSCGGMVCLITHQGAPLTVAVPMTSLGPGNGGIGGQVEVCSDGNATINAPIDVTGGGCGGCVGFDAIGTVTVSAGAQIVADGGITGAGGSICISGDAGVALNGSSFSVSSPVGDGGCFGALSNGPITSTAAIAVTGGPTGQGGDIDIEALRNLSVTGAGVLDADGGTGGIGGTMELIAGAGGFPGSITMNVAAHTHGGATAPSPETPPSGLLLDGCTVHLGSSANIDSSGDLLASNQINARTALVVDSGAHVVTTGTAAVSRNFVVIPSGAPAPPVGAFSPPLAGGDVRRAAFCTGPNDPPGCLEACPVCGNHVTEFPETCDPATADACCDALCRTRNCDDGDPCTVDSCDPVVGCTYVAMDGCTPVTTSTTVPTTTSTTTSSQPSTTTTATEPTTSTTLPAECGPDAPLACDDGDLCTADACIAGHCTHVAALDFDAVLCRLDGAAALLRSTPVSALGGTAAATRLETAVQHAHDLTVAGKGESGRRRARRLGKAAHQLAVFMRLVQRGTHKGKIAAGLAGRLLAFASSAVSELTPLRTAP
jgi:slime mold repeat-containing protein